MNADIGFKSLSYSVTESSRYVEITVIKKTKRAMTFMIKTADDTAVAPDDYEAIEEIVTMDAEQEFYHL